MAQLPPHVPEYVTYAPPKKSTPAENITVPLVLVFFGAAGLVSATYFATMELSKINGTMQTIARDVSDVRQTVSRKFDEVERDLKERTASRWSRVDHDIWCARTEILNSALGWRCAPVPHKTRDNEFSSIDGWAGQVDPRN